MLGRRRENYFKKGVSLFLCPLWKRGHKKFCNCRSVLKWRTTPFLWWDKGQKLKLYLNYIFKKISFRTTWSISTKFGTRHAWMVMIQVCSNVGPHSFSSSGCNIGMIKCDLRTPELVDLAHQLDTQVNFLFVTNCRKESNYN